PSTVISRTTRPRPNAAANRRCLPRKDRVTVSRLTPPNPATGPRPLRPGPPATGVPARGPRKFPPAGPPGPPAGGPPRPPGVLVAEAQTSGRGRMGRRWISPPRRALTFSVLLRPAVPAGLLGWVPLLAGVAVASALQRTAGVDARLKWPNDVLVDGAKIAGILAERWGNAIVIGTGINVLQQRGELPVPTATSLLVAQGARPGAAHTASAGPAAARAAGAARVRGR